MDLPDIWQWGITKVLFHPFLERAASFLPCHSIFHFHVNFPFLNQFHTIRKVSSSRDLDQMFLIVIYAEIKIHVEKISFLFVVHSSYKCPNWHVITVHLNVIVLHNCILELQNFSFVKFFSHTTSESSFTRNSSLYGEVKYWSPFNMSRRVCFFSLTKPGIVKWTSSPRVARDQISSFIAMIRYIWLDDLTPATYYESSSNKNHQEFSHFSTLEKENSAYEPNLT